MSKVLMLVVWIIGSLSVLQYFWMGISCKKKNKGKKAISDELIERLKE